MASDDVARKSKASDDEARKAQAKGWRRRIEELRSRGRRKRPPRSPREFADREAAEAARSEDHESER
jgi:hypothetical protein